MHRGVTKVGHTFMWDRNYSDENGNDHEDESKNIDTSHGKNSDSIMKSPLEE